MSAFLLDKYDSHGVRILPGTKPIRLVGDGMVESPELDNGETLPVDLVVMGIDIELNTLGSDGPAGRAGLGELLIFLL